MALQPLQENAKIVTLSRRNLLVQERRLPVRRRLFSRADDTESQSDLKSSTDLWLARHLDNMRLQLRQASYKWGYDFEADRPNPVADCEFVWTAVPANQVPLPYRTCGPAAKEPKVRTDQSTLNTSSTPTVPCPGRKRPRQTSLNEFFAVSKQSPNEPSGDLARVPGQCAPFSLRHMYQCVVLQSPYRLLLLPPFLCHACV
ncbi:hypothetical protein M514_02109 [Trichuris suis]|uniref:Uncharacterized protein n=1 Tax=Trichuris suis TaxID=68888 RepID=A0A085MWX8_9BILA|nr:hypothetical protein M514_02109 [Trichuris suis]